MTLYWLWLKRVLFSPSSFFQLNFLFSLLGLAVAVASLTVAVLAFNGFSSGLEKILIEKQGHIRLQARRPISKNQLLEDISPYREWIAQQALFLSFRGLIIKDSHFKGAAFEAIQDKKLKSLPFLKSRLLEGNLEGSEPFIILGFNLAKELKLKVGYPVQALVSQTEDFYFSKKRASFKLGAIADFGQHELNSSFVFLPLSSAKKLGFNQISGASLWLKKTHQTSLLKQKMKRDLRDFYLIQSWRDRDKAFLEVIESDKKIIFFVLLVLVLSAGFNISSSLFAQVFKKTQVISILKAMGAKKGLIIKLFLLNGLILGFFGALAGILAGLFLCYVLVYLQNKWRFIPSEVYKINEIVWDWQSTDLLLIFIVSLLIVILSSLWPALRAYKMNIQAGLSHN